MNSESRQRLPTEELKRRNASQPVPTQTCPSQEEWGNLLLMISALYLLTTAQGKTLEDLERHTALLREASSHREPSPTWTVLLMGTAAWLLLWWALDTVWSSLTLLLQ